MPDWKKDGGSAFPHPEPINPQVSFVAPGMSLRDWFAGQAIVGLAASNLTAGTLLGETQEQANARWAYTQADAMLAARENRNDR